ncbi:hypothetical protein D3C79_723480 [compost metagenome]
MLGGAPTNGGFALVTEQGVAALIIQGAADVGVGDLQAHRALTQIHRIVVIDQACFQLRIVIEIEGGLVAQPGTARLRTAVIAAQVGRVGRARVVLDLLLGQASSQIVLGFAVAQVKAGFQVRVETVADVGGDALAAAAAVILVTVVFGIGQRYVVVQVTQYLAGTDLALGVAAAADLVAQLQRCGVAAGVGDVVDGAAQGQ